jgi:hypothetical protein
MADVILSRTSYEGLLTAARQGNAIEAERIRTLVDAANDIRRYRLYIRWQDIGGQPPRAIELGKGWPPDLSRLLELERPIALEDVEELLSVLAANPVHTHVTLDPHGIVGWTLLSDFDFSAAT